MSEGDDESARKAYVRLQRTFPIDIGQGSAIVVTP
jgi:hypothetical protein